MAVMLLLAAVPALASGEETAAFTVSVNSPDKYADAEDAVTVYVMIRGGSYNAYHMTFAYNEKILEFTGASFYETEDAPQTASASGGVLTVMGYGAEREGSDALLLHFRVIGAGDAPVQLRRACIDKSANALTQDAPAASILTASVTIHAGGCAVELDARLDGPGTVRKGQDYTFSAPQGYDYRFDARIDGVTVPVINNGDGTYTVKNVTGTLVIAIVGEPTPSTYSVTLYGTGSGDVLPWSATAQHGQAYTLTLQRAANYDYAVSVTVGGRAVQAVQNGSSYTIPGDAILGDVVIVVTKVPLTDTTQLVFVGNGAADLPGNVTTYTVTNNEDFVIALLNWDPATYDYTVTGTSTRGSVPVQLTSSGSTAKLTVPGSGLQGGIVTVTITKTPRFRVSVTVNEYVKLRSTTVFRVLARPVDTLSPTQGLYYSGMPMYWSEEQGAYIWLVTGSGSLAELEAAAAAAVTVGRKQSVTVSHSGDVNGSGLVDINDAQLAYDMYNCKYELTGSSREKFLSADVNGDGCISVLDANAVLARLRGVV